MTEKPTEFQAAELLRAIGRIPAPEPLILEHAREVLWSAVASEMLGTGPASEQTTVTRRPAAGEDPRRTTRQRQTGQPQNERKMSRGREDRDN